MFEKQSFFNLHAFNSVKILPMQGTQ